MEEWAELQGHQMEGRHTGPQPPHCEVYSLECMRPETRLVLIQLIGGVHVIGLGMK